MNRDFEPSSSWIVPPKNSTNSNCLHALYRKTFELDDFEHAEMLISAGGICKLYLNGLPVIMLPASDMIDGCLFDRVDVSDFLMSGENVLAVHVGCKKGEQNASSELDGGINLQLLADGKQVLKSDSSFLSQIHSGYSDTDDSSAETYDSRSAEVQFEFPDYDDNDWTNAKEISNEIKILQRTECASDEIPVKPKALKKGANSITVDFGQTYNGCLYMEAEGLNGCEVELCFSDGQNQSIAKWTLSGGYDSLDQFDPLTFNTVEIKYPKGTTIDQESITLLSTDI